MTDEQKALFLANGRGALTTLAQAAEQLSRFAASFEARGGTAELGNDALEIVYISNDLQLFLTATRRMPIARLRTDV